MMHRFSHGLTETIKRTIIISCAVLLVGLFPAPVVFAHDGAHSCSSQNPIPPGVDYPTGSAAHTYCYNESTGVWENDYYTWNPATHVTMPKVPLEYTYNPATGMWDTVYWQYSAAQDAYYQATMSVATPPDGAITHGGPPPPGQPQDPPAGEDQSGSSGSDGSQSGGDEGSSGSSGSDQSGGSSSGQSQGGTDLTFSVGGSITNNLNSSAHSGNGIVIGNTTAGSVGTGDANSIANILNLLQSQSSLAGPGVAIFTANIQGNVQGDFLIDPAAFNQQAAMSQDTAANLKVNNEMNANITNNITLDAGSGSALADQNTTAGDVTSGNANAVADVINMINSVVAANQSFLGVININGDYTGNILVPTDSLNALLASTGPSTQNSIATATDVAATVNADSTQNITNNAALTAESGNATASENTTTGNVSTGDALTNLTILNLTGRQVTAANSLLVFVNVLGNWVGLIMDAPAGTTAAAYGGGITNDKTLTAQAEGNFSDTYNIVNNIDAKATSGDAAATRNTTVGNVRSGNATASANIANITNSQLSLSNWFGILFINVFGTWRGNFGLAKPPIVERVVAGGSGQGTITNAVRSAKVFAFVPSNGDSGNLGLSPLSAAQHNIETSSDDVAYTVSEVLSDSIGGPAQFADSNDPTFRPGWTASILPIALGLAGLTWVGIDRYRTNMRKRNVAQK